MSDCGRSLNSHPLATDSNDSVQPTPEYHPIMRLYEPGIVYSKVRFLNNDEWLSSYGEDGSNTKNVNAQVAGIRIWETRSWSMIHLIQDGTSGLFPYCCGWKNPYLFCMPN